MSALPPSPLGRNPTPKRIDDLFEILSKNMNCLYRSEWPSSNVGISQLYGFSKACQYLYDEYNEEFGYRSTQRTREALLAMVETDTSKGALGLLWDFRKSLASRDDFEKVKASLKALIVEGAYYQNQSIFCD